MRDRELVSVCTSAAEALLSFTGANGTNLSVAEVESYHTSGKEHIILVLARPIEDTDGLRIRIEDLCVTAEAEILFYDRDSRTLAAKVPAWVFNVASEEGHRFSIETDLSFLVRNLKEYYERFGESVSLPRSAPCIAGDAVPWPDGPAPTPEQREAVRAVLSSPMSYVWGAPGTGKTQEVLAASVSAYLAKGRRVAVIAPTNNAVEQVLRGLISAIGRSRELSGLDPAKAIIRLGTATEPFASEYPSICEGKGIRAIADKRRKDADLLRKVLAERRRDSVRGEVAELMSMQKRGERGKPFSDRIASLSRRLEGDREASALLARAEKGDGNALGELQRVMYGRDRPAGSIP